MQKICALLIMMLASPVSYAQCILKIEVHVTDSSNVPAANATVTVDSIQQTFTDKTGRAGINSLCAGDHMLRVSFSGYENIIKNIIITGDTFINIRLVKKNVTLKNVTVTAVSAKKDRVLSMTAAHVTELALLQSRGNTLGESLKSIPGLNSLQTGPGLSKPIIHGLHGSRVVILNNGIKQEGQQWGSEHAPEIDPFIASQITIIKGAAGVRYGSDAIAGVILLEPGILAPKKTFEGEANLIAGTNGRLGAASALAEGRLNKKLSGFSWRLQGTLKQAGNFRTPKYFLLNSGISEKDYSGTLAYQKGNYGADIYFSRFYNKVGIFSGTHVGNVNDLYAAFKRAVPITASYFSYSIDRTYQRINHDLLKINAYYKFKNNNRVEAIFSSQKNLRDEFDIDLPYTTDPEILKKPQISFKIHTENVDLVYEEHTKKHLSGSIGINGSTQGNVFNGIRYLIPNFRNYTGGAFAIERFTKNRLVLEAGLRYDYRWLRVYRINNTNLQTYHSTLDYSNLSGTIGGTYRINSDLSLNFNAGSGWRAPSINELYINGIHLSAASYEKGDSTLRSERSYDFTGSLKYQKEKVTAEFVIYDNVINNFIYARPSLQPIQLISGTYPYFNYTQADVNLSGLDLDLSYEFNKSLNITSKTALLRGWNRTIHDYLVFLPADKFDNTIKYNLPLKGNLLNSYVSVQNVSVLKQKRVPPNSDYVAPPPGYSIFNIAAGFITHVSKKELSVNIGVDNITNVSYRDYLNRFRYYADDPGINAVLRTKLAF